MHRRLADPPGGLFHERGLRNNDGSSIQSSRPASFFTGLLTDLLTSFNILTAQLYQNNMVIRLRDALFFGSLSSSVAAKAQCSQSFNESAVDLAWHPPNATNINNLRAVINGTGVNGFIFNSSVTPATAAYSTYNWCNMPHVRRQEYVVPPPEYSLEYVEVVRNVSELIPCRNKLLC